MIHVYYQTFNPNLNSNSKANRNPNPNSNHKPKPLNNTVYLYWYFCTCNRIAWAFRSRMASIKKRSPSCSGTHLKNTTVRKMCHI